MMCPGVNQYHLSLLRIKRETVQNVIADTWHCAISIRASVTIGLPVIALCKALRSCSTVQLSCHVLLFLVRLDHAAVTCGQTTRGAMN